MCDPPGPSSQFDMQAVQCFGSSPQGEFLAPRIWVLVIEVQRAPLCVHQTSLPKCATSTGLPHVWGGLRRLRRLRRRALSPGPGADLGEDRCAFSPSCQQTHRVPLRGQSTMTCGKAEKHHTIGLGRNLFVCLPSDTNDIRICIHYEFAYVYIRAHVVCVSKPVRLYVCMAVFL